MEYKTATSPTRNEKVLLYLLAFVNFTHIMDFMVIMPLGDLLMKEFSISAYQFSIIVSSYTFSAGIAGFLGAFVIDRYDRKKILLVTYIGFSLGTILCALAPTYEILLVARSVSGAFGGLIAALVLSIVSDAVPHSRRGAAMGIVMAAFSLASVFGVPFGLYLADIFSEWHAPFYFLGIASLVACALLAKYLPNMASHLKEGKPKFEPLKVIKNVVTDDNQLKALSLSSLLVFGQFTVIPFITPYLLRNVGFVQEEVKYMYLLGGGLTIFTSPLMGKVADKFGKYRVFAFLAIAMCVPVLAFTNLGVQPMWLVLTITSLFFITASGRMAPIQAIVTSAVSPKTRGSFMSFRSSVQQIASGLAATLTGLLVVANAEGSFENYEIVGYIAAVCSLLSIFIARKIKVAEGNQ